MISSLDEQTRFVEYRNELTFLQRQVKEFERRRDEIQFHLTANRNKLLSMEQHSQYIFAENRYFEREIVKLDLALEELFTQLRVLKRKIRY